MFPSFTFHVPQVSENQVWHTWESSSTAAPPKLIFCLITFLIESQHSFASIPFHLELIVFLFDIVFFFLYLCFFSRWSRSGLIACALRGVSTPKQKAGLAFKSITCAIPWCAHIQTSIWTVSIRYIFVSFYHYLLKVDKVSQTFRLASRPAMNWLDAILSWLLTLRLSKVAAKA